MFEDVEVYDPKVMEPDTGLRAVWLLYKKDQWGYLEDFGLERAVAEPQFQRFERDNVVTGDHLNSSQCRKLKSAVPGSEYAAKELQLAYALKFIDKGQINASVVLGDTPEDTRGEPDRGTPAVE